MNDENNRQMIKSLLENTWQKLGVVRKSIGQYCLFDLYTSKYAFELKERFKPSTEYDDNMCEWYKAQRLQQMVNARQFDKAFLISTYTDGIIRISQIKDGEIIQRKANHNTYFSDRSIITKEFYSIKQFTDYRITKDNKLEIIKK